MSSSAVFVNMQTRNDINGGRRRREVTSGEASRSRRAVFGTTFAVEHRVGIGFLSPGDDIADLETGHSEHGRRQQRTLRPPFTADYRKALRQQTQSG